MISSLTDIILCDDHYISLVGLDLLIQKQWSNAHIRYATTGEEALKLFEQKAAGLMVIDLGLPKMSGLELIKMIRSQSDTCKIIVLSATDDTQLLQIIIQQKVSAILKKNNSAENIVASLELLQQASAPLYIDPAYRQILKSSEKHSLSLREYEILELMAQGYTGQEMANHFNCSMATIKTHRMRMMNKTGCRNSAEILAWFLTKGKTEINSCS